jgi:peptidyl-prolyl cis-trans isomerase C
MLAASDPEISSMRRLLIVAATVALAHAGPLGAQTPAGDPVVARVDGEEIKRSEIEAVHRTLPEQYRQMPVEMLYEPLLQRAIDTRLLANAAEKQGLPEEPGMRQALDRARDGALRDEMIQRALDAGTGEAALRAAYEEAKAQPGFTVEEVHARHILLESEADARAVIAELDKGADFAELAKARSKDPSAAQNSGDLGFFKRDAMVPEFSTAAFTIAPGTYGKDPVKSQFGWHVILVEEKRSQEPSFEEKQAELRDGLSRQILERLVADAREGVAIERFNIDGTPQPPQPTPAPAPQ